MFRYERFCVLYFDICTPSLSPPLPSGVQISKKNRRRTFHTRIFLLVYNVFPAPITRRMVNDVANDDDDYIIACVAHAAQHI